MAARLVLDALVADLYGLDADDLAHIAAQFPIYDRDAPAELRYPRSPSRCTPRWSQAASTRPASAQRH